MFACLLLLVTNHFMIVIQQVIQCFILQQSLFNFYQYKLSFINNSFNFVVKNDALIKYIQNQIDRNSNKKCLKIPL